MRLAQQLYEGVDIGGETVGLITYMRTDGVTLSREAIADARQLIGEQFGANYVPEAPRVYKTKAKNAQEAHEAIRPTDLVAPAGGRRAVPRQRPAPALRADLEAHDRLPDGERRDRPDRRRPRRRRTARRPARHRLGHRCSTASWRSTRGPRRRQARRTPRTRTAAPAAGDARATDCGRDGARADQHFTQPPPRYTEASLVKKLEELGIGRPSTYASILDVLQDRDYVRLDKRRFIPEDRGRLVTAFLESFFARYVEYDFTAELEEQLDDDLRRQDRLEGRAARVLAGLLAPPSASTKDLTITEVIDALDEELGPHFFPAARRRPRPARLPGLRRRAGSALKLGKFGAFIGCSHYPECRFTRPLAVENGAQWRLEGTKTLGVDPVSNEMVSLRKGPYGLYVQLGEGGEDIKPKRVSLPKDVPIDDPRPRHGAEAAGPAARGRPASGGRQADPRRPRPLRPLPQAQHRVPLARIRRTTC